MDVREFLLDYFSKKGLKVTEDEDLFKNGYIDSISFFRLILELEVNFDKILDIDMFSDLDKVSINNIIHIMEK